MHVFLEELENKVFCAVVSACQNAWCIFVIRTFQLFVAPFNFKFSVFSLGEDFSSLKLLQLFL